MSSPHHWQKSSFSTGGSSDDCVELAAPATSSCIHLREGDDPAVVLTTGPTQLRGLLNAVKRGMRQSRTAQHT